MTFWQVAFWFSAGVCLYLYAGYAALLWIRSRVAPRPIASGGREPSLSIVIPVHNEAEILEAKLANTFESDYPREKLEVLVVSDGSTDGTAEIAAGWSGSGVRLLELERSGKAAALNAGAAAATGEILVLSDANGMLERSTLKRLVAPFGDPEVGGVCAHKRYRIVTGSDTTEVGENLYWRYDSWQKRLESAAGSVFAADGTLYALRRELYSPIVEPAQADDIAVSTRIVLGGARLVYAPEAVVWEEAPTEGVAEFRRKVRVTNHSVRALWNLGGALWSSGFYSVQLLSHKLLRHLAPIFLASLVVANAFLLGESWVYRAAAWAQGGFYGSAALGFLARGTSFGRLRALSVPYYFSMVNFAALLGVLSILRGERLARWTPRQGRDLSDRRRR